MSLDLLRATGELFGSCTQQAGEKVQLIVDGEPRDLTASETAQVTAKAEELQAEYVASQYQRDRKYPTLTEQADMQYWDALNGTTTWQDAITAVKAEFPKTTGV